MDWLKRVGACGLLLGVPLCASCADDDALSESSLTPGSNGDGDSGDGDGHGGSDSGDGDGDGDGDVPVLPPEIEESLSFDVPQAGKTSVYVPNPVTNRVAV